MSWDDELTLSQPVYRAYAGLAAERQNPDVPIHELDARVGGSLPELHDFLRAECFAHHALVSSGEPAFASKEARRTPLPYRGSAARFSTSNGLNRRR